MGHHAESLLSRVREREIRYSGGYADLSLKTLDMIKELILCVQEALGGKPFYKPPGYNELMRLLENPENAGISEEIEDYEPEPDPPLVRVGDILIAQGKVDRQDVEKALPWAFSITALENAIIQRLHFQRLAVVENGDTSLYRRQAVEKRSFSTAC